MGFFPLKTAFFPREIHENWPFENGAFAEEKSLRVKKYLSKMDFPEEKTCPTSPLPRYSSNKSAR
jgi:hypothetical protein